VRYRTEPPRASIYGTGSHKYYGENPPPGAQIFFALAKKPEKISLKVLDYAGETVRELEAKPEPGLQRVAWDLRRTPTNPAPGAGGPGGGGRPGGGGGGRRFGGPFGAGAPPGMYRVVLTVDGKDYTQGLRLEGDPTQVPQILADDDDDD
jgi:hypothetical protein